MQSRTGPVLVAVVVAQALLNAGLVGYCAWQNQEMARQQRATRAQIAQLQAQLPAKLKELNDDLSGDFLGLKTQVEQQRQTSTKQLSFALEGVAQWGYANGQSGLGERLRTLRAYVENDKYWTGTASTEPTDPD